MCRLRGCGGELGDGGLWNVVVYIFSFPVMSVVCCYSELMLNKLMYKRWKKRGWENAQHGKRPAGGPRLTLLSALPVQITAVVRAEPTAHLKGNRKVELKSGRCAPAATQSLRTPLSAGTAVGAQWRGIKKSQQFSHSTHPGTRLDAEPLMGFGLCCLLKSKRRNN